MPVAKYLHESAGAPSVPFLSSLPCSLSVEEALYFAKIRVVRRVDGVELQREVQGN